jgi:hypothetical protein
MLLHSICRILLEYTHISAPSVSGIHLTFCYENLKMGQANRRLRFHFTSFWETMNSYLHESAYASHSLERSTSLRTLTVEYGYWLLELSPTGGRETQFATPLYNVVHKGVQASLAVERYFSAYPHILGQTTIDAILSVGRQSRGTFTDVGTESARFEARDERALRAAG